MSEPVDLDALERLERDLLESIRSGYLFGRRDEPLDAYGRRLVRVIQERLSEMACTCPDYAREPREDGTCRACGHRIFVEGL